MRTFKVLGLTMLGLMGLLLWATPAARSAPQHPLVPTATRPAPMTPTPSITPVAVASAAGAYIELHTSPNVWTIVQWQDGLGAWHTVDGWQGSADELGHVQWWVAPAQFGLGSFRWVIFDKPDGTVLTVSQLFHLPQVARHRVVVEMIIQPQRVSDR